MIITVYVNSYLCFTLKPVRFSKPNRFLLELIIHRKGYNLNHVYLPVNLKLVQWLKNLTTSG